MSSPSDSRFLITGAGGFIGKALCSSLVKRHEILVCSSSKPTAYYDSISLGDLFLPASLNKILQFSPTHLIHCAAIAHRSSSSRAAWISKLYQVNVDLPIRLSLLAKEIGVSRFIFISSIGIHGSETSTLHPFSEQSPPQPANAYAASKWLAEVRLRASLENSDCSLTILRPALVYGPSPPGNIKSLIRAIDCGLPLPLKGINNKRSYVSLVNLVDAIEHVALHPRCHGQSYVISDEESISTPDLIRTIARIRRKPLRLFQVPPKLLKLSSRIPGAGPSFHKLTANLLIDSSKIRTQAEWIQPMTQLDAMTESFRDA